MPEMVRLFGAAQRMTLVTSLPTETVKKVKGVIYLSDQPGKMLNTGDVQIPPDHFIVLYERLGIFSRI